MPARIKISAVLLIFVIIYLLIGSKIVSAEIFLEKTGSPSPSDKINKIFVKFKKAPNTVAQLSLNDSLSGAELLGGLPNSNVTIYQVSKDIGQVLAAAKANGYVEDAFPVPKVHVFKNSNDPLLNLQWALTNLKVAGSNETAWDKIADIGSKTGNIKVAVVDTGIDRLHPDLVGKISNTEWVRCNSSSCTQDDNGTDGNGHGTHIAGIIGASTDNAKGIAGVGWNVKLMSVKVLEDDGSGDSDAVLKGVTWAADHGVKVINLSLGIIEQNLNTAGKALIQEVVNYAWNKGVIIVASAGNCGAANNEGQFACAIYDASNNISGYASNPKVYPAASDHVLSVAAIDSGSNITGYSEYGDWVDVAAPGGEAVSCASSPQDCILSAFPNALIVQPPNPTPTYQPYTYKKGTSMAAPQVAGVAALIFAANSSLSNSQVVDLINNTAVAGNIGPGKTIHGVVDAYNAVAAAANPGATATPTPTGNITPSPTSGAPTNTPVPTPTGASSPAPKLPKTLPSPFPSPPYCPDKTNCQNKSAGDADCNGIVDQRDYEIWKLQFDTMAAPVPVDRNANFSCTEGNIPSYFIDMIDFEIWRRNIQGSLR